MEIVEAEDSVVLHLMCELLFFSCYAIQLPCHDIYTLLILPPLFPTLGDPFGNYVIQQALVVASEHIVKRYNTNPNC